jgi:hypothetical protein
MHLAAVIAHDLREHLVARLRLDRILSRGIVAIRILLATPRAPERKSRDPYPKKQWLPHRWTHRWISPKNKIPGTLVRRQQVARGVNADKGNIVKLCILKLVNWSVFRGKNQIK